MPRPDELKSAGAIKRYGCPVFSLRVFIESPFKFSGLSMQQQKDEAKAPHLWLVTGAI
ncbi:hypothetical protein [Shewanella sp. 10N.286.54.B9]|uniref:hypothetical protein n=1 Tax=Shewanella sp. 10N.286.54.B9 TaxID=3229719 RepID=UPI003550FE8F